MNKGLKPCPFCGSEDFEFFRTCIVCHGCGAMGPDGKTVDEAMKLWNRRVGEGAHDA